MNKLIYNYCSAKLGLSGPDSPNFNEAWMLASETAKQTKQGEADEICFWMISYNFSLEELNEMKTYNKIKEKCCRIEEINYRLTEISHEYSELNKMGRRAKAAMVRKLLDNSTEGKKLLSSITKIKPLKLK